MIRVSESTKRELLRYAAELQAKLGRKVSLDEAIANLLREAKGKRPDLLLMACSPVPLPEEVIEELYRERRRDEERAKRKYSI